MYPVLISLLIDTQLYIKRSLLYQIGIYLYFDLELLNITNWRVVYHSDLTPFFFGVELEIIQNCLVPAPITLSRIYGSQDHVVSSQAPR